MVAQPAPVASAAGGRYTDLTPPCQDRIPAADPRLEVRMSWLFALSLLLAPSPQAPGHPVDVSSLIAGPPTVVVELDLGKLKGEPRQLCWSPDLTELYLQTAEGKPPQERLRHYVITVAGGAMASVERVPAWAVEYWNVKQDRIAPGMPSLEIAVEQTVETLKTGVGQAGVLDRQSSPSGVVANNGPTPDSLAAGQHGNSLANVVRLKLVGEEIAIWVNERPIPGTRFGWGPSGTGSLVCLDEQGSLVLFDRLKHRQTIKGVKDAMLPAWSADGARLAYVQKLGKKRIAVATMTLGR